MVFRRADSDLLVKLPFADDNRTFLSKGRAARPAWNLQFKCWELPRSAFNELARRFIDRYGQVYLIQPLNPDQECCASCQNAKGLDCECGCMGKNHGVAMRGTEGAWFDITGGFPADFKGRKYQVQLVERPVKILQEGLGL